MGIRRLLTSVLFVALALISTPVVASAHVVRGDLPPSKAFKQVNVIGCNVWIHDGTVPTGHGHRMAVVQTWLPKSSQCTGQSFARIKQVGKPEHIVAGPVTSPDKPHTSNAFGRGKLLRARHEITNPDENGAPSSADIIVTVNDGIMRVKIAIGTQVIERTVTD
jgi:hypothetical protein